jgi:transcriptional regulator NrdR family protein
MRMCQCGEEDSQVVDTRTVEGSVVRRRRQCPHCSRKWTTYEVSAEAFKTLNKLARASQAMAATRRFMKRCEEWMGAK